MHDWRRYMLNQQCRGLAQVLREMADRIEQGVERCTAVVIQEQSDDPKVRRYLTDEGYAITLVFERRMTPINTIVTQEARSE